jgi:carbon monoxide dehydrogenase subunit G
MKIKILNGIVGLLVAFALFTGCNDDDEPQSQNQNETRYTLGELENSGVSGTVTFTKMDDATTRIAIELTGTTAGNMHPAHIHSGNASTGGPIVVDFSPVDGATGRSETMVTELNDGTPITYEELIAFDGHVNIHLSAQDLSVMIAQGNIGANATGQTPSPDNGGMDDGGDDGGIGDGY